MPVLKGDHKEGVTVTKKKCEDCGEDYVLNSKRQERCDKCKPKAKKVQNKKAMKKIRKTRGIKTLVEVEQSVKDRKQLAQVETDEKAGTVTISIPNLVLLVEWAIQNQIEFSVTFNTRRESCLTQ